ncbi:MAG: hypothetical protein ACRDHG_03215 [Anaerolineales bacterium]
MIVEIDMDALARAFAVYQSHAATPHPVDAPFVFGLAEYLQAVKEKEPMTATMRIYGE